MYPAPCVECGGVDDHTIVPMCPAVLRGAGGRRNECGSVYPRNRAFHCTALPGHEASDPFCENHDGDYPRAWLFEDAEHWPSHELRASA